MDKGVDKLVNQLDGMKEKKKKMEQNIRNLKQEKMDLQRIVQAVFQSWYITDFKERTREGSWNVPDVQTNIEWVIALQSNLYFEKEKKIFFN